MCGRDEIRRDESLQITGGNLSDSQVTSQRITTISDSGPGTGTGPNKCCARLRRVPLSFVFLLSDSRV